MVGDDGVRQQLEALGGLIRSQRQQAQLTLRELAAWQGLGDLEVVGRGDLAHDVAAEAGVPLLPPA